MGTIPFYILAFLFVALLGFVYFFGRLFLSIVEKLTNVLAELKAFSMGKPEPESEKQTQPFVKVKIPDEDFGFVREEEEEEKMPGELDLR